MKYELTVLAALVQLNHPTTKAIAEATRISKEKVEKVVHCLESELQMQLLKGDDHSLTIISWGVFESGSQLENHLLSRDLLAIYKERKGSKKSVDLSDFNAKHRYFEKVKSRNYRDSLRLEGHIAGISHIPEDKTKRAELKKSMLDKYSRQGTVHKAHG